MTKTDVTMTVIDDCGHFSAYEHPTRWPPRCWNW